MSKGNLFTFMIGIRLYIRQTLEADTRKGSKVLADLEGMLRRVLNRDHLEPLVFLLVEIVVPPVALHLDLNLHDVNHFVEVRKRQGRKWNIKGA